ncbi:hypothetical protein HNY73_003684 [Argiope bruennichi]|uniref:Uncharacterized protein n=1 Tax=Argiope bruennichi TaxID=94029 RepID=A0A8T0FLF3_ARGBR|nr:hypothetical protein HNY73_003684 [Argiope bruennichi]
MNIENAEFPLMDTSPSLQTSSDILAKTTPPAQHFIDANSICDELRKCSADIKAKISNTCGHDGVRHREPRVKMLEKLEKTLKPALEALKKRGLSVLETCP